ncbi:PucR family transcriptional regulator ligand-binding domain-containing protein [Blastococcus litoris]|uniref:PucR family transcriptional regulator ligand-binding domain-containing protein n=1 Tax=Blastococcus litoris TaxID=2171622 RepID=UPI0030B839E0
MTRDDRTSWQERMGLTVEEALQLPGLAGTSVAAGGAGLGRVVRHMVVDDPADPLAAAGPDVLVVLGARLPPADPANCRALVERLDSMGTAALAFRRTEGPAPVPGEVLAEAERRGLPVLALPATVRLDEIVSEVLGAVVTKQGQALALSSRMDDEFMEVALTGGGLAEVTQRLAVMLEGTAVLGLGPDREVVTSAGPRGDVEEISDWLWLLDAAADDALAELTPSRRLSGVRADQTVVTPADVLADADLSPADGILLVPGHHELPGGVGEYAVAPIMAGDQRHGWLVAVHRSGAMMLGAGGVLERAAVIAALSVIRLQAVHSVELRFQGDLVRRLVGGSVGHTERTLAYTRSFGWRLDGPVAVLVTATETVADAAADPTKALDVLERLPTAGAPPWSRRSPARRSRVWRRRSSPCCRSTAGPWRSCRGSSPPSPRG